jgi:hypothetical protein
VDVEDRYYAFGTWAAFFLAPKRLRLRFAEATGRVERYLEDDGAQPLAQPALGLALQALVKLYWAHPLHFQAAHGFHVALAHALAAATHYTVHVDTQ